MGDKTSGHWDGDGVGNHPIHMEGCLWSDVVSIRPCDRVGISQLSGRLVECLSGRTLDGNLRASSILSLSGTLDKSPQNLACHYNGLWVF